MSNRSNEVKGGYQPNPLGTPQGMYKTGDGYQPRGNQQPSPPPIPPKGGSGASNCNPNNGSRK
jgi:hypothetical protein